MDRVRVHPGETLDEARALARGAGHVAARPHALQVRIAPGRLRMHPRLPAPDFAQTPRGGLFAGGSGGEGGLLHTVFTLLAPSRQDTVSSADDSNRHTVVTAPGRAKLKCCLQMEQRGCRASKLAQALLVPLAVAVITRSLLLIIIVCLRADASLTEPDASLAGPNACHSRLQPRLKTASSMC